MSYQSNIVKQSVNVIVNPDNPTISHIPDLELKRVGNKYQIRILGSIDHLKNPRINLFRFKRRKAFYKEEPAYYSRLYTSAFMQVRNGQWFLPGENIAIDPVIEIPNDFKPYQWFDTNIDVGYFLSGFKKPYPNPNDNWLPGFSFLVYTSGGSRTVCVDTVTPANTNTTAYVTFALSVVEDNDNYVLGNGQKKVNIGNMFRFKEGLFIHANHKEDVPIYKMLEVVRILDGTKKTI